MFPLIAERHSSKKSYYPYLFYSIALVTLASLFVTIFYFIFPEFSVNFFFGKKFLEATPYLGFFGIFITLYSICNILVSFFLSVHKTKVAIFLIAAALLQWLLISLFHSNFWEVIGGSVATLALLTIALLLYLLLDDDFRNRSRLSAREND
jgi:O-antigen/teichoic acid export membrane protein